MKKLLMTVAVMGFAASIVSAQVYSQNIVGYAKKSPDAGQFLMVSPQFQGSANGMTLGDAFVGVSDESVVFTWDGSSYTKYTYFSAAPGWFDNLFAPADDVLVGEGDGVWLQGGTAAAELLIAGEVPSAGSITNTLVAGFNMVANPYPVAMTLGELPADSLSDEDVVFTWDGSTYTKYTYFTAAPGWFDNLFAPADDVEVAVGDAFWLDSAAGGALILDKQY